jgi:hypothetical protein
MEVCGSNREGRALNNCDVPEATTQCGEPMLKEMRAVSAMEREGELIYEHTPEQKTTHPLRQCQGDSMKKPDRLCK